MFHFARPSAYVPWLVNRRHSTLLAGKTWPATRSGNGLSRP